LCSQRQEQDQLSDRAHAERFAVALDVWPHRRGASRTEETKIGLAGVLKHHHGLSRKQIADLLSVSEDTVRRKYEQAAEPWYDEVVGPNSNIVITCEGSSRWPRVVEGYFRCTFLEFAQLELGSQFSYTQPWVNLPANYLARRPNPARQAALNAVARLHGVDLSVDP
jgi:hypothetical protein